MQFVPHAVPDDGRFALTMARQVSKLDVLLYTPNIFAGKLAKHDLVTEHFAKSIRVESVGKEPTMVEVDGEYLGETPVEFFLVERGLCFLRG